MASSYDIPSWAGKPPTGLHLDVLKEDKLVQKLMVDEKRCYLFGRNAQMNDFCIDHASCSRVHAVFVYHKHLNIAFLLDLGSTHGTFIGSLRLEAHKPTQLPINSIFHFGASTRNYILRERPTAGQRTSIMEDLPISEITDGTLLGLPESQTELDNLTEYNTAHNRRISILGIGENSLRKQNSNRQLTRRRGRNVTFNDEEIIINPEDVDPKVGRFRNLIQTTVVPTKRIRHETNSVCLQTSYSHNATLKSSHSSTQIFLNGRNDIRKPSPESKQPSLPAYVSLYQGLPFSIHDVHESIKMNSDSDATSVGNKLGLLLPNPAPDVNPSIENEFSMSDKSILPQILPVVDKNEQPRPTNAYSPSTHGPHKKKYAKEAWPGRKPMLGPTVFASSRCVDPISAFILFIEPFEMIVVNMTILYGDQWQAVDIRTMRAYYGILLLAGVYRSHGECVTELWNDKSGRAIFRATMSLKRYKEITRCLRFDDREERANLRQRDKLAPIRTIFDKWAHRLKLIYLLGKNVTIDEQLLPYRGRCPFTQYMPSKPCKYGIKLWALCDAETFYVYDIEVYIGRDRNCAPEVRLAERVVLKLTEGLNGQNVTCNNFFTSRSVAEKLKQRQITIVGTIRKNRKELPPLLLNMKKKPLFHSEFVFDHDLGATLVSYVTKCRRFVTLLSTFHKAKKIVEGNEKKKPEIIAFYNSTKCGVDIMDEMVGTYRCKRKINRWPVAAFCNMLDISALNAYILYIDFFPSWNYTKKNFRRRLFLIELGNSLVYPHIEQRERTPRGEHSLAVVNEARGCLDKQPSTSAAAGPPTRRLTHHTPSKKRARCHICPQTIDANKHSWECDKCRKKVCPNHRFILCEKCEAHK